MALLNFNFLISLLFLKLDATLVVFFLRQGLSLCSPGGPEICYIDQTVFELTAILLFLPRAGIKSVHTIPASYIYVLKQKITSSILYSEDIIYAAVYLFLIHVQMLILKSLLAITFFWTILKLSFSITQEHIHNKTPISISSFHLTSICACAHMVVYSVWMWCMLTSMHVYMSVCAMRWT